MPRLYFDLHECGVVTVDEEGVELAGMDAARAQATTAARSIMCDEVTHGRLCLTCSIEIRNEAGDTLELVPFKDAITITGL